VNDVALKKDAPKDVFKLKSGTVLSYYRTSENEIIDLELVISENQKLEFDIFESKFDLFTNPLFKIEPRSNTMMPMPFVLNDATIIKSNIKL